MGKKKKKEEEVVEQEQVVEVEEKEPEVEEPVQKVRTPVVAKVSKRTPQQQIDVLDKRLGVGVGAKRERAYLRELMNIKKSQ
jgi:hypothetical protein